MRAWSHNHPRLSLSYAKLFSFADYPAARWVEFQHFRFAWVEIKRSAHKDLSRRPTDRLEVVDEESLGCPTDAAAVNRDCVREGVDDQQICSNRSRYMQSRSYGQPLGRARIGRPD